MLHVPAPNSQSQRDFDNYTTKNTVEFIRGGEQYFILLEKMINEAKHSILLQTYIYAVDTTGIMIGNALILAAKRGISVYVMADGYASKNISNAWLATLQKEGVHFRFFGQIFRNEHLFIGRRMHHKIAVIDGKSALVGGLNIADHYNQLPDQPCWMDAAVFIQGEAAVDLFNICINFWGEGLSKKLLLPNTTREWILQIPKSEWRSVRVRRNDWLKNKMQIWKSYFNLFSHATKNITIMGSYFLPGLRLQRALAKAARRGVNVKVILTGRSDVLITKAAERYLYDWMLRCGIRIYEYQPSILHAKLAVVDGRWLTLGSFNINRISTYAGIELNVEIRNRQFADTVDRELDEIINTKCLAVNETYPPVAFPVLSKLMSTLAFRLINMLIFLFTFYVRQERPRPKTL